MNATPPLIAVGGSLGGAAAFGRFARALPERSPPIVLVLHRSRTSTEGLAALLERRCGKPVCEVEDGMPLRHGVHLAPPDYHLLVDGEVLRLSVDSPVRFARPSIDVLFDSVAEARGRRAAAVLLTAASQDGARGLRRVAEHHGATFVQDPEDCESPVAPQAALHQLRKVGATPVVGTPAELGLAVGLWGEGVMEMSS